MRGIVWLTAAHLNDACTVKELIVDSVDVLLDWKEQVYNKRNCHITSAMCS